MKFVLVKANRFSAFNWKKVACRSSQSDLLYPTSKHPSTKYFNEIQETYCLRHMCKRKDANNLFNCQGRGSLGLETSRVEGFAGWIFNQLSIRGVNLDPNRSNQFSQKWPKKSGQIWKFHQCYPNHVAQNETTVPNRSMFDIWRP